MDAKKHVLLWMLLALLWMALVPAAALDASLSAGLGTAAAGWINEQLLAYGEQYREPLPPMNSVYHARIDARIPEWTLWRFYPAIGLDLRTASRNTEGGPYSAGLLGMSGGVAASWGQRLIGELSVVLYRASFDGPAREDIAMSGWGVGGRFELTYRLPLAERLGLELGFAGDLASVGLADGGRDAPLGRPAVDFSGIGISIGLSYRGGRQID